MWWSVGITAWCICLLGFGPKWACAICRDVSLLPFAGLSTLVARLRKAESHSVSSPRFIYKLSSASRAPASNSPPVLTDGRHDHKDTNKDDVLIVYLHGSGFNWTEWLPLMHAVHNRLTREWKAKPLSAPSVHGSDSTSSSSSSSEAPLLRARATRSERNPTTRCVRSLAFNYAEGWLSNADASGIELYSQRVRVRVKRELEIMRQTARPGASSSIRIAFVGHSLGGFVAEHVARHHLKSSTDPTATNRQSVHVASIITLGTPWRGAPLLTTLPAFLRPSGNRYLQMKSDSCYLRECEPRLALESSFSLHCVASQHDFLVPGARGCAPTSFVPAVVASASPAHGTSPLAQNSQHQHAPPLAPSRQIVERLGHYSLICSPAVMNAVARVCLERLS